MESKKITQFVLNDRIEGYFAIRKKNVREFTKGQFLTLELGDASGRIDAVWWEPDQFGLKDCTEGMVVKIRGTVSEYNRKTQVVVERMRVAVDGEYAYEDVVAHSPQSKEQRINRICGLIEKVENTYVKSLLNAFFTDPEYSDKFFRAPGAKLWHHAYIGGLSEHSANVAELAIRIAGMYDFLNRDLLIFGGLMHDAGKVASFSSDLVLDYTDEGRLVGHICLADSWITERAGKIDSFPPKLLMKLRHMVLAHQGTHEQESPVEPMIPEAFVVYYSDELDARMNAIDRYRNRTGKGWSEYVKLLERFLYFDEANGDLLKS